MNFLHAMKILQSTDTRLASGGVAEKSLPALERILVPTDFSSLSLAGVESGLGVAKLVAHSVVTLVHVLEAPGLSASAYASVPWYGDLEKKVAMARAELERLRVEYESQSPMQMRLLRGSPAPVICDLVQEELYDLLVVSSHGLTGLSRLLIGSVAERLLNAACSIMVVKPAKDENGEMLFEPVDFQLKHLLVGYDQREGAQRALAMARKLSLLTGAQVTLIHAIEPPNYPTMLDILHEPDFATRRMQQAERTFDEVRSRYLPESAGWEFKIVAGHPWEVIPEIAEECQSDLVLIGDHQHTRWGHGFVGSTVQRVVRLAKCPVMVVKASPTTLN